MKVLLLNGSPHEKGCTYTALFEIQNELARNNVESEIFHIGNQAVRGCTGCGSCVKSGRCVFDDDAVNSVLRKIEAADGLIVGSPVHFAGAAGSIISCLDRVFYAGKKLAYKPAASIVSARRAGTTAALDQLNKYFMIRNMPVVSSQYWNMVHGSKPEDVQKDMEGLQIMRTLARNMAWLLKSIEAGKLAGINLPEREEQVRTNFIR